MQNDFTNCLNNLFGDCKRCNKYERTITKILNDIRSSKKQALEEVRIKDEFFYIKKLEEIIRDTYYQLKQLDNLPKLS